MKQIITISCLLISLIFKAQVYSGSGGLIQNNGQDTYYAINVSGLSPSAIDSTFGIEQICFSITHPDVSELYIYLKSPAGIIVELTLGNSSSGSDFTNACFDKNSNTITLGIAPYTGTYSPVGYLGRFNTGQTGNGSWNLIVHDGFPTTNAGNLISWNMKFGNAPAHPVALNSSNLPLVFINTTQPITETNTTINMGIINNGPARNNPSDQWNDYNNKAQINIRGNTSKNFEKKSFSIETHDAAGNELNVPLLGMPAESDWVLGANYLDKTLIRNPLTLDLFRSMGHYSSRYKNVELFLNNEYQGVYSLIEKPKRNVNRVNIAKLDSTDNTLPYVSGGYIIKIDRPIDPGWYSLLAGNCPANSKFFYQYVYPRDSDITVSQRNYIQGYVNDFETMMSSSTYADPVNGYPKYIDVDSFIDFFIINELSKNIDGYRLSTYLYKKSIIEGGKFFAGPLWDYDIAWHNCNYNNAFSSIGWAYQLQDNDYPIPTWWTKFMQDPAFVNKLNCRWNSLRQNTLNINRLNQYIDSSATVLNESQKRNFTQWPTIGAYISPNPQNQTGATYLSEVNDLKTWITNRISWMDANIADGCAVGINENSIVTNLIVYPNPMESKTTFSMKLESSTDISLCITDMLGKEVARFLNTNVSPGESTIAFERNQIPSGIYLYQLEVNNIITSGKIVVQ
ncbi:MAG: CotH kinase family protein [Burkholderiales bacterium]|nr:CotH kinase family protein [Bacteroidia bacterium]